MLLKDVLGYSLSEVAGIADSTLGGVKAALHRGRAKLREAKSAPSISMLDVDQRRLFDAYAECFNRRDWDALAISSAPTRDSTRWRGRGQHGGDRRDVLGQLPEAPLGVATRVRMIDGAPAIVHWRRSGATWHAHTAIKLGWKEGESFGSETTSTSNTCWNTPT